MSWLGRSSWKNPFTLFINGMKKIDKKKWVKVDAVCNKCGNEFTITYSPSLNTEKNLQCSKCKARDSKVVYIYP